MRGLSKVVPPSSSSPSPSSSSLLLLHLLLPLLLIVFNLETRISAPIPQRPKPRVGSSVAPLAETSEEGEDPSKKPKNSLPIPKVTTTPPNASKGPHLKDPANLRRRGSPNAKGSSAASGGEVPSVAPIPMGFRQSQRAQPKSSATPTASPLSEKNKNLGAGTKSPRGLEANADETVVSLEDSPFLSGDEGTFVSFPRKLIGLGIGTLPYIASFVFLIPSLPIFSH